MIFYTSVAVFLFCAVALVLPSGFSLGASLLVVGSLALLWKRPALGLGRSDLRLIAALAFYFLICSLANLVHGAPVREYDAPLRFALAIPALLLLIAYPPRPGALWTGLAIGAIGAGLLSGWQNLLMGETRAGGYTNPIQYGNISLLLGVLCAAGMAWARSQDRTRFWTLLLGAGTVMGVLGSLFSGSRGGWISLPLCALTFLLCYGRMPGKRQLKVFSAILLLICLALAWSPPAKVAAKRLGAVMTETADYFHTHDAKTSSGARLEMWRMGLLMFPSHPLLGWGKEGYMDEAKRLAWEGKVDTIVTEHSHLHNEYVDALVKRGIFGLAALLGLFLLPLSLFISQYRAANPDRRCYAVGGMLICVSYIGFGLTQAFLTHNNGVMILAFMLAVFWSLSRNDVRQESLHPVGSAAATPPARHGLAAQSSPTSQ